MPNKKRTKKTSTGSRRSSRGVALTEVEKILLGVGMFRSYRPLNKQQADDINKAKAVR